MGLFQFAVKPAARIVLFTAGGGIGFPASIVIATSIIAVGSVAYGAYKFGKFMYS